MRRTIVALFAFALYAMGLQAQKPQEILDKAATAFGKAGGVSFSFLLTNTNTKTKAANFSQKGEAQVQGNKFRIVTDAGTTWFDGKTQWTYIKEQNEVNVSSPDGEELAAISPVSLLNSYKAGFRLKGKGNKKQGSQTLHCVEMTPQQKNSQVSRYEVNVDAATAQVASITIYSKDGNVTAIKLTNYRPKQSFADKTFIFDKKAYPKAEVIDLR